MCSIYCSNVKQESYDKINFYLKFRGPDYTNTIESNGYTFLHNLLSMTGEFTTQPFVKGDVVCLYNGEIYNFKTFGDYKSDGECLIPLYEEHGEKFIKKLEGEFAIILFDFAKNKIIISSDIFRTKPIYYSISNGKFGCSTFKTPLELAGHVRVRKMPPNTAKIFDLKTLEQVDEYTVHKFDLNQHKDSFDDWNTAFHESMKKRVENTSQKIFIGLSSGYDSGAICLELLKMEKPFKAYSVTGTENDELLNQRLKLIEKSGISTYEKLSKTPENYVRCHDHILKYVESFTYTIDSTCPITKTKSYQEYISIAEDSGSNWLSYVCEKARAEDRKMYLSGMGADEIFSDYGHMGRKIFNHSNFGGLFPDDLSTIFPWNSFYGSTMESYLAKEEFIGGSYGLEARYPYLDVNVVQEFLHLTPRLKNGVYKSVVDNYLTTHNFPFCKGQKLGF